MSKNKDKQTKEAAVIQFQPAVVEPVACTTEELDEHLEAFVEQFLEADVRERWLRLLIDKRSDWFPLAGMKNSKLAGKFNDLLLNWFSPEPELYTKVYGEEACPLALTRLYGTERGVYFDGFLACKLTAAEAASVTMERHRNGILSLKVGRKAIFFEQDWESGWKGAKMFKR